MDKRNQNKAYNAQQKTQDQKLDLLMYLYHNGKISDIKQLVVITQQRKNAS